MAKETKETSAAAVAEPEQPTPVPQTAQEIAATEQALGLAPVPAKDSKAPQTLPARVPVRMGVAPTNIEDGWRLAQFIAQSELVPKGYRGRPADVLVAIQYGMEVGLPPMAALHSIFVTNGRPSLWGDGFLAVIMAAPSYRDHDEYYIVDGERKEFLVSTDLGKDDTMAVCTFWRKDSERPRTATFSIAKAKKAGLWTKQGPWSDYPDRMLKFRARGFAGHDGFPDVLRGIRTAEEVIDMPEELPPAAPLQPRRASEARVETIPPPAEPSADPAARPPATNGAPPKETRGLRITDTQFVKPLLGEPYYQIVTISAKGHTLTFITQDEPLYKEAASFEGSEHFVAIGWQPGPQNAQKPVLVSLALDETTKG